MPTAREKEEDTPTSWLPRSALLDLLLHLLVLLALCAVLFQGRLELGNVAFDLCALCSLDLLCSTRQAPRMVIRKEGGGLPTF
jgi:hypothetical protein